MEVTKGRLFLIPSPLGDVDPHCCLPEDVFGQIAHIGHFAVEEIRTARRFLSLAGFRGRIDALHFYEVNEHSAPQDIEPLVNILLAGNDMGVISEAGLPAVADPGAYLVALAHRHDIDIVPFIGPSSLMMALMSSGLNGQCFAFKGYIPVKPAERKSAISALQDRASRFGETQIIIETPYRNDSLLKDLLEQCRPDTRICIAADITLPTQFIRTRSVAEWKKDVPTIGKRPCVFLVL